MVPIQKFQIWRGGAVVGPVSSDPQNVIAGKFAKSAYADYTDVQADAEFKNRVPAKLRTRFAEKRYMIISAWRNILDNLAQSHHIATLDCATLTDDDVVLGACISRQRPRRLF